MEVLADYHVGKIQVAPFCLAGYIYIYIYSLEKKKTAVIPHDSGACLLCVFLLHQDLNLVA